MTLGQLANTLNTMLADGISHDTQVLGLTEIGNMDVTDVTVQRGYGDQVSYIAVHVTDEE